MKFFVSIILCLIFILTIVGCSPKNTDAEDKDSGSAELVQQTTAENNETSPENHKSSVTFMVYMIGSDLEARSGAGTNDLTEMAESGVDTEKANVIVYAGGSKKWHNDAVESEEDHNLLHLTDDGFKTVETFPASSMGDAECLTGFLNYACENYPADRYVLIMWDHGDGPVIGYGKDMLYDNDSLTLLEMKTALDESPFGVDNKLSWVGFDACLMSSAELACVWADYADYMIASQEIEPAFGWDYKFLSEINESSNDEILSMVTDTYLASCEDYFKDRGYEDREATLSCLDLSYAEEAESALNSLFEKASDDIGEMYNALTAKRVNTRALGRASTGSEYDLIDLGDMASQLAELYPDEAEALADAVDNLVLINKTNTEGLCGVSLFYPFYNKSYYERSWGDVYSELCVFSGYVEFLQKYAEVWLDNDLLESVASSITPDEITKGAYSLELTDEQSETYASATYYILQREGAGIYTKIFSSQNVTKQGNELIASFDGNVIYAKNGNDDYFIPVTYEHDKVGDITRYSAYVNLTNDTAHMIELFPLEGYERERQVLGHRFHLAVNEETGDINISALVPYNVSVDAESLVGGKIEDSDLSEWTTYYFLQEEHRYIERDENGVIYPVDSWPQSAYMSANVSYIDDGLEFLLAPLSHGEYCLIFEISDTQGNKYCSEPIDIETEEVLYTETESEEISVRWEDGSKLKLYEKDSVTIYLTTVEDYNGENGYVLMFDNGYNFPITIINSQLMYNGEVYCYDGYIPYVNIPPNTKGACSGTFDFGVAANLGFVKDIESLQFCFDIVRYDEPKTLVRNLYFDVALGTEKSFDQHGFLAEYDVYTEEAFGVRAEGQLLAEEDGLRIYLEGIGGNGITSALKGAIKYENTTDSVKYISADGIVLDGIYVPLVGGVNEVLPGCIVYDDIVISDMDFELYGITSVSEIQLQFEISLFNTLDGGGGFADVLWYPVRLECRGDAATFEESDDVVFDENGVRIAYMHCDYDKTSVKWYFSVVNESDSGVTVSINDFAINGVPCVSYFDSGFMNNGNLGAGQKTISEILYVGKLKKGDTVSFTIYIYDFTEEQLLFAGTETIELTVE